MSSALTISRTANLYYLGVCFTIFGELILFFHKCVDAKRYLSCILHYYGWQIRKIMFGINANSYTEVEFSIVPGSHLHNPNSSICFCVLMLTGGFLS